MSKHKGRLHKNKMLFCRSNRLLQFNRYIWDAAIKQTVKSASLAQYV